MKKNEELINALIKKKRLVELMKFVGIKRVGFGSIEILEKKFGEDVFNFCLRLKEEMDVNGKKVLEIKEIDKVIEDFEKEEEFEY